MELKLKTSCDGCLYNRGWDDYIGHTDDPKAVEQMIDAVIDTTHGEIPCADCYPWNDEAGPRECWTPKGGGDDE